MRRVAAQTKNPFLDPAAFPSVSVPELLEAAASGHAGIDQRWIRAIVDRGELAVPDLLAFGLADHSSDPVNLEEDLIAMFRYLATPKALPFYIRCIRENPEDVSDELIDAIVPFGPQALEPLLELYDSLEEEQAGDVAFLLAALGVRDVRIRDRLVDRMEYDAGEAALALSVYRDPSTVSALEDMLSRIPLEEDQLRREFTLAIEASRSADQTVAAEVEVEPEPFDIWELYADVAAPPVESLSEPELLDMLASPAPEYRCGAAQAFRNREEYSRTVQDRLLQLTKEDPFAEVRGAAWEALGEKLGDPGVREALKTAVADETRDIHERTGALVGLAQASDDRFVADQIRRFYDRPETRAKALEAMWRSFDRQFAGTLAKHLDDTDIDCRRAAVWGVGYLGLGAHAGKIATMFEDVDIRTDALFAYALLVPSEISHGRVPGLFRKINDAAGGLSYAEAELVQSALDQRLVMHGLDPYFAHAGADWEEREDEPAESAPPSPVKPGRNDPCPCGSGKKYKKCHGA
jgi:hypothetical protein